MLENPDFTIPPTGMTFEVNGVQETFVFGEAGIDMNAFHAKFPNLEFSEADEVRNNSTTEHLRIRFQVYPPEQDGFVGVSFTDNPTGGSSNGWSTVCLAPATTNSCVPTQIAIQLPDNFFLEPHRGHRYYLSWNETINGVTISKTSYVDYPVPDLIYTYTSLIADLLSEYSKPGNSVNNGTETEVLGLFTTQGTDKFVGQDGARGSQPTTIQILPTSPQTVGAGIDLYSYFLHPNTGAAPAPVHSCGWDVISYQVNSSGIN